MNPWLAIPVVLVLLVATLIVMGAGDDPPSGTSGGDL